jgi:archaellum component FlaF (FlaF/FlaG flagellin family)
VFGEQITAERHTEIIEEFQYNINTKTLTTTTANGGTVTPDDANLLFDFPMARQDSKEVDVRHYHFALEPGETVTITGQSSQSNDITFFASWREEF